MVSLPRTYLRKVFKIDASSDFPITDLEFSSLAGPEMPSNAGLDFHGPTRKSSYDCRIFFCFSRNNLRVRQFTAL
jgi:hypothetical protein